MAQSPWLSPLMVRPEDEEMMKLAMAGTGIPGLDKMVQDISPSAPEPNPPADQVAAKQKVPAQAEVSQKVSSSSSGPSPELSALAEQLRGRMEGLGQDRLGVEQAGVDDYQAMLQEYLDKPRGIDWTPLAGLLDQWAGGSSASQAAQAMKPETAKEKMKNVEAMKKNLQAMKGQVSDRQYKMLESQLDSVIAEMKQKAAEAGAQESMYKFNTAEQRRDKEQQMKYLQQLQNKMDPVERTDATVREVEAQLGFNLDEFNKKTQTLRGKPINAPGVQIPLIGRINQNSPEAKNFKSAIQRMINLEIKERSGAAVSAQEAQRVMAEFLMDPGRLQTEGDFLSAVKDFASYIEARKRHILTGYDKEIRDAYFQNVKDLESSYQRRGGAPDVGVSGGKKPSFEEWRKAKGL